MGYFANATETEVKMYFKALEKECSEMAEKEKPLVEEVCNTCMFYSFCKNIQLPYCDKRDYVKEK